MAVRVLVCRGCCCGTERKHPAVDHEAQLAAIGQVATARVVGCVDECARSNVIIVRPGDGTSIWLGGILTAAETAAVCEWLADGAPRPVPANLAGRVFERRSAEVVPVLVQVAR